MNSFLSSSCNLIENVAKSFDARHEVLGRDRAAYGHDGGGNIHDFVDRLNILDCCLAGFGGAGDLSESVICIVQNHADRDVDQQSRLGAHLLGQVHELLSTIGIQSLPIRNDPPIDAIGAIH